MKPLNYSSPVVTSAPEQHPQAHAALDEQGSLLTAVLDAADDLEKRLCSALLPAAPAEATATVPGPGYLRSVLVERIETGNGGLRRILNHVQNIASRLDV